MIATAFTRYHDLKLVCNDAHFARYLLLEAAIASFGFIAWILLIVAFISSGFPAYLRFTAALAGSRFVAYHALLQLWLAQGFEAYLHLTAALVALRFVAYLSFDATFFGLGLAAYLALEIALCSAFLLTASLLPVEAVLSVCSLAETSFFLVRYRSNRYSLPRVALDGILVYTAKFCTFTHWQCLLYLATHVSAPCTHGVVVKVEDVIALQLASNQLATSFAIICSRI